jgi:hypothetical protein
MFGRRKNKVVHGHVTLFRPGDIFMMPGGACYFVEPYVNPSDPTGEPRIVQIQVVNIPSVDIK